MVSSVFGVACKLLVPACGIWFPGQGLVPGPLHWEHGVLATGPPGKSQVFFLFVCLFLRIKWWACIGGKNERKDKLGKGISYGDWGPDLTGDREVQPAGQKRSLLVCPAWDWLLASKKQCSGLQVSLQRKTGASADRKPLAANAGRSPSGHWLPCWDGCRLS